MYSEETDFAQRARDRGYALRYDPAAVAVHLRGEAPSNPRLWRILQYNRYVAFRRAARRRALAAVPRRARAQRWRCARPLRATHAAALVALVVPGRGRQAGRGAHRDGPDVPGYVCFSGLDWWYHSHADSDFQLMLRVARTRPVLLVNSIGMRVPVPGRTAQVGRRLVRKARSVAKLLRRPVGELPGFHVMTPLSIPLAGRPRLRALNAALVRVQVRLAMRSIGMRPRGMRRHDPDCVGRRAPARLGASRLQPIRQPLGLRRGRPGRDPSARGALLQGGRPRPVREPAADGGGGRDSPVRAPRSSTTASTSTTSSPSTATSRPTSRRARAPRRVLRRAPRLLDRPRPARTGRAGGPRGEPRARRRRAVLDATLRGSAERPLARAPGPTRRSRGTARGSTSRSCRSSATTSPATRTRSS